jgi:hypothetical protein
MVCCPYFGWVCGANACLLLPVTPSNPQASSFNMGIFKF